MPVVIGIGYLLLALAAPPEPVIIETSARITIFAAAKGEAKTWHCTAPKPLDVDWTATVRTCGWE